MNDAVDGGGTVHLFENFKKSPSFFRPPRVQETSSASFGFPKMSKMSGFPAKTAGNLASNRQYLVIEAASSGVAFLIS